MRSDRMTASSASGCNGVLRLAVGCASISSTSAYSDRWLSTRTRLMKNLQQMCAPRGKWLGPILTPLAASLRSHTSRQSLVTLLASRKATDLQLRRLWRSLA